MQVCTSLQTNNHTSTPPLSSLQAGCPSCRPTNSVKALKANKKAMVGLQKHKPHNLLHCTPIEALCSARARLLLLAGHHGCEGAHGSMSPRGLGSPQRGPGAELLVSGSGGGTFATVDPRNGGLIRTLE